MATNKKPITVSASNKISSTRLHRSLDTRVLQNYRLVWLHENIDEANKDDHHNSITKLRRVVNSVNTFSDVDECIDFISHIKEEEIFIILSGSLCQTIVPIVQQIPLVNCIYVYCENKKQYEKGAEEWYKVKSVCTDIGQICESLKQAAQDCDHNSVSISFIKTTDGTLDSSLDSLDQSFMYTQILKEILLTIDFQQEHINEFLTFCLEGLAGDNIPPATVEKLRNEYHDHQPIWWYTWGGFLYSMVNRALRLMEVDLIIKLGFFIRDLHNHIVALHSEQYIIHSGSSPFTVYRGQGLSQLDFDQLKKTQDGLIAFNNFLSTSLDPTVAFLLAESNQNDSNRIGVLFAISINPLISSSPFANIRSVSYFPGEEEILFSMHCIFRIGEIKKIDNNDRLWQVDLTLTCDNDQQLQALTVRMREETASEYTGWHRLGQIMITLGQFDKAKELYEILLKQTTDEGEKGHLYYQLGSIRIYQGEYKEAITVYENALEIYRKSLPSDQDELAGSYNSIGLAYDNMGESMKALLYYEKAQKIAQETLPEDDPRLYAFYNNIGAVYSKMGEYSKALSYYEKAHEFLQKTLPPYHLNFITSYNNTGWIYNKMGEYRKALSYYEKAHEISQKTLPTNHPRMATSYNSLGSAYDDIHEYSKSLSCYEKALEILQITLPPNHPELGTTYNNIGAIYENMGEQSQSLKNLEKALDIRRKSLPPNHPDLASSYNNIGVIYDSKGKQAESLAYLEKALEIRQTILPANHPSLASTYNSIGNTYYHMNEYSIALSYYERALDINQHSLPSNHPVIGKVKGSIEFVKNEIAS